MPNDFVHVDLRGEERVQEAIRKTLLAVKPEGGLGRAVRDATVLLFDHAKSVTHRKTGALAVSHHMEFASGGVETFFQGTRLRAQAIGRIFIREGVRNPINKQLTSVYGPKEHARGGTHAFYARAFYERGQSALNLADRVIRSELPR